MYFMVLLVLDNIDQAPAVLDAWEAAGTGGVTILESTGLGRMRKAGIRDDMPMLPSITNLLKHREERHRTIFTVVEGEGMVDKIIELTQAISGDLDDPHNGVLFVLPVLRVEGLRGAQKRARGE